MTLLSLGMFPFSIPTLLHDELQRRADWRHPGNPRVGARDAQQFTGPGPETMSITGTAMAELSDGEASLDELREMAGTGDAWPLVDGAGRIYGDFKITGIDERMKLFFPDGTARRIDFAIDLLRSGDDPA
ncbi:phage tail protein [Sphingomonas sp. LT1P40]|uniref:phage tail protein n=1 Tax=Alteristakelama amylovorans TaxID=3096166 RepID=UPI002FC91B0E